jgi:pyocin large subunit-like protein
MDHSKGEASPKSIPQKLTRVAPNNPDNDEPSHNLDAVDAFKETISRQAAARAARYANRPPLADDARQQAIRELDLQERLSRLRPFKLVLKVFIGAVIFAGIMFYTLGIDLGLPFPSASAPPDTLQPPHTTATTKPLLP